MGERYISVLKKYTLIRPKGMNKKFMSEGNIESDLDSEYVRSEDQLYLNSPYPISTIFEEFFIVPDYY